MCYICSMKLFKDRLAFLMEHFDLSQSDLAERSGVSRSSIGHMLNGRNQPSMDFLAGVLQEWPEIDADWLVMGKGPWKRQALDPQMHPLTVSEGEQPLSTSHSSHDQMAKRLNTKSEELMASVPEEMESCSSPESGPEALEASAKEEVQADTKELLVLFSDGTYRRFLPRS